jgi:hypothetical protein
MGWMDAHEYFVMEQAARDRRDDAERFTLERAFQSEAAEADGPPSPAASVETTRCPVPGGVVSPWSSRQSSTQHV